MTPRRARTAYWLLFVAALGSLFVLPGWAPLALLPVVVLGWPLAERRWDRSHAATAQGAGGGTRTRTPWGTGT